MIIVHDDIDLKTTYCFMSLVKLYSGSVHDLTLVERRKSMKINGLYDNYLIRTAKFFSLIENLIQILYDGDRDVISIPIVKVDGCIDCLTDYRPFQIIKMPMRISCII